MLEHLRREHAFKSKQHRRHQKDCNGEGLHDAALHRLRPGTKRQLHRRQCARQSSHRSQHAADKPDTRFEEGPVALDSGEGAEKGEIAAIQKQHAADEKRQQSRVDQTKYRCPDRNAGRMNRASLRLSILWRTCQTPGTPVIRLQTRTMATACCGGMTCNSQPSENSAVSNPARPFTKPPLRPAASRKTRSMSMEKARYPDGDVCQILRPKRNCRDPLVLLLPAVSEHVKVSGL